MRARWTMLMLVAFVVIASAGERKPSPDRLLVESLVTGTPPAANARPPEHIRYRFDMTYFTFNEQGMLNATTPMAAELTFHPADGGVEWTSMIAGASSAPG